MKFHAYDKFCNKCFINELFFVSSRITSEPYCPSCGRSIKHAVFYKDMNIFKRLKARKMYNVSSKVKMKELEWKIKNKQ